MIVELFGEETEQPLNLLKELKEDSENIKKTLDKEENGISEKKIHKYRGFEFDIDMMSEMVTGKKIPKTSQSKLEPEEPNIEQKLNIEPAPDKIKNKLKEVLNKELSPLVDTGNYSDKKKNINDIKSGNQKDFINNKQENSFISLLWMR